MSTDTVNALYEPPRGWIYNRAKWREQVDAIRAIERDRIIHTMLTAVDKDDTKQRQKAQKQRKTEGEIHVQNI